MAVIYISLYRSNKVKNKKEIIMSDIANISAPLELKEEINKLCLLQPHQQEPSHYIITMIDVIDVVRHHYPEIEIKSIGECEAVVDYNPKEQESKKWVEYLKVTLVCAIVFAGAMVAIMAYQTDISLKKTFAILYESLTGNKSDNPLWITIPYSIGMPLGILIFFNHIGPKKLTNDPTPIQIEINTYEKQSDDTIIDVISNELRGQKK